MIFLLYGYFQLQWETGLKMQSSRCIPLPLAHTVIIRIAGVVLLGHTHVVECQKVRLCDWRPAIETWFCGWQAAWQPAGRMASCRPLVVYSNDTK